MKTLATIGMTLLILSSAMFGQAVGDYGTSVAAGTWTTAAHWVVCTSAGSWTGATVAAAAPSTTTNVWILNGHTMTIPTSGTINCKDVNIENGGILNSATTPSTSNRYLKVYGNITNNGTFGGLTDGLSLNFNADCVISGTPTLFICNRLQPNVNSITITFNCDVSCFYPGSAGTGGSGIYANAKTGIAYVVSAGKTLTVGNLCNFSIGTSTQSDGAVGMDLTVNGTVTFQTGGNGGKLAMKPGVGNVANITVNNGGTINLGQDFLQNGLGTTNVVVNAGGAINNLATGRSITLSGDSTNVTVNGTGTFSTGANTLTMGARGISGTGNFTLSPGGEISISNVSGLEPVAGPIRTTTRTFNTGASFTYSGTAAQVTGSELPSLVRSLTINNALGVTLGSNVTVDTSLTFTSGKLITNANTITVKGVINSAGAGKFVEGNLLIPVNAASVKKWEVGQNTDYIPFVAGFSSVTGSDNVSVKVLDKDTVAPLGTITASNKVLRHYFRTAKGAGITAFAIDSVVFNYTNADAVEQNVGEDTLRVYAFNGAGWSSVTISRRDTLANTITVTGVTSFSDFVITGAVMPVSYNVTFQVNMKVQSRIKKFNPAKDTVIVRGDFWQGSGNWWDVNSQKLVDPDGDSIYVGTFDVGIVPKRITKYKFVMRGPSFVGDQWEADMGTNKDRTDTIPSTPWTLPVVWFSNDSTTLTLLTPPVLPLDFESTAYDYTFLNFDGGAVTKIANPQKSGIDTSANVGKMIKSAGQPWGGAYISLAAPIDFSVGKTFKAKVFMPKVGAKLLLKVENQTDGSVSFEKEATGTVANAWEELTFDYSAINTTKQYQKLVLIFDLGTMGDGSANFTYLFDDIKLISLANNDVTFQVNMKNQMKLKKFDKAKDTVVVRGDFQGWGGNAFKLTDPNNDSIYVGTFPITGAPRLIAYKFVMLSPNVAGDQWEAISDRKDSIPSTPMTLPVRWYNNDSTTVYSDNFITFQVNMKKQMRFANFDKTKDSVVVRGDFNGWAGSNTNVLTDPNTDSIYTGTFNITSVKKIIYKFVIHKSSGDTWESSSDRVDSLLNGSPRTEPVVWFSNDSVLTGVRRDNNFIVTRYELLQNYPNPFNPSTSIDFDILSSGWVTLTVYNVVGQEVATIVNQQLVAGRHTVSFNANNLTSGVYFYKITAGTFTSIKKMMLLK